ncbi:MAG: hypothetical protein RQ757_12385 [Pseudomonadales bacterium]|nr:hypothetical protein [Pseudomonadales bacterium]
MIKLTVVTLLTAYMVYGHADQSNEPDNDSFTPFVNATREFQDSSKTLTDADERENSIQGLLSKSDALPVNNEQLARESYFRLLARQIETNTTTSQSAGIELSREKQLEILDVVYALNEENRQSTTDRVEAMCNEWNLASGIPDADRADRALDVGKEMELAAIYENPRRQSLYANILSVIGENRADELDEAIRSHAERSSTTVYSWSDMVRQTGRKVDQFKFMCGE